MKFLNKFFGKNEKDKMPQDELDHWMVAEVENDDAYVVYRLRTTKPPITDIKAYATGISMRWNYDGQNSGMPSDDVNAQQLTFEEAIEELSMYNGHSFLTLVSTGINYKEWLFYAKDRDGFMKRLNGALKGHPKYPLEIEFYDDAEWKMWNDVLGIVNGDRT